MNNNSELTGDGYADPGSTLNNLMFRTTHGEQMAINPRKIFNTS